MLVPPPRYVDDWHEASTALQSLRYVKDNNRAEVRLFYDELDGITWDHLQLLAGSVGSRKVCASKIRYRQFPPGMSANAQAPWTERSGDNWGYLHMIRFFFVDLLDPSLNLLSGFKYWARLDTDAQFMLPVPDLFAEFDTHPDLGYVHNYDNADCGDIVAGLRDLTKQFIQLHGVNPSSVKALDARDDCVMGWYNNFEAGRIAAFQTPKALEFTKAVVDSKGIYRARWGDALLRRILVETANITTELIDFKTSMGYRHPGQEDLITGVNDAKGLDYVLQSIGNASYPYGRKDLCWSTEAIFKYWTENPGAETREALFKAVAKIQKSFAAGLCDEEPKFYYDFISLLSLVQKQAGFSKRQKKLVGQWFKEAVKSSPGEEEGWMPLPEAPPELKQASAHPLSVPIFPLE